MTDEQLRAAARKARAIAAKVGPLHAYWDAIFDAEALLEGRPSIVPREQVEQILAEALEPDEWFEMECPTEGGDFDIRPMPYPGDPIECTWCGQIHAVSADLGNACRRLPSGEIEYIAEEWSKRVRPALRPDQIATIRGRIV